MQRNMVAGLVALMLAPTVVAQEAPPMVTPQKEHQLLQQFAGEWVTEGEMTMGPDQPVIKTEGTESTRTLGGFWLVSEHQSEFMGTSFTGVMTVGYDAKKKKYVGTWVCSVCDLLWHYEGTIDKSGKVLTLETEGPDPTTGKMVKMKDVVELKDKDHKTLSSYALGEDGKWHQFMTLTSTRKK